MKNKYLELTLENGFLVLKFADGCQYDKEIALNCVQNINEFLERQDIKKIPLLVACDSLNPKFNYEGRKVFASVEATERIECIAIVVKNLFQKFLGEMFIKVNQPRISTKLFHNSTVAINWINESALIKKEDKAIYN